MSEKMFRKTAAALLLITLPVYADRLMVLAASSTTEALNEIAPLFTKQTGHTVQFSFGSAGALARQIQNGASADVFISANEKWMAELAGAVESRVDLLKNRLVLIAPKGRPATLNEKFTGKLAVGNMESVPAGMYAKQVLEKCGWFKTLKPRLVSCDSVRNVLLFVECGEVEAGIVYATDAKISDRVTVATVFPEESHEPIRYPAAVCSASKRPAAAREFLAFLQSPEATKIFERYGFER